MIYDRTYDDCINAKKIIRDKLQKGYLEDELSDEELAILERGTITMDTLNRIETAEKNVASRVKSGYYLGASTKNKEWQEDELFRESDFERIRDNAYNIRKAFLPNTADGRYSNFLEIPYTPSVYEYSFFNRLEEFLDFAQKNTLYMIRNRKECGNAICGEL